MSDNATVGQRRTIVRVATSRWLFRFEELYYLVNTCTAIAIAYLSHIVKTLLQPFWLSCELVITAHPIRDR